MAIFFTFAEKKFGVLFTTNLAARGLDFPSVEWIVQVDCPEDAVTYIHRIGRTARYKAEGNSLLFLLPSEMLMVEKLKEKKMELSKLKANPEHQLSITNTLQSYLVESIDLKYLAQRAFISYVRSVFFSSDKTIFNTSKIDLDGLAESFGLIQTPIINVKAFKAPKGDIEGNNDSDEDNEEEEENDKEEEENDDQLVKKKQDKLTKLKEKIRKLKLEKAKKRSGDNSTELEQEELQIDTKLDEKLQKTKKPNKEGEEEKAKKITKKIESEEKQVSKIVESAKQPKQDVDDSLGEGNNLRKKQTNVKHDKLIKRTNQDVFSENFKKLRAERDNSDGEEFLVKKVKGEKEDDIQGESSQYNMLRVSKNQLKKIKDGGYFDGKNITFFDEEGQARSSDQMRILKYKENEQALLDDGEDRSRRFALKLMDNKEMDDQNERLRRKEKRGRRKMKDLEKNGIITQRNEAILGSEEGSDQEGEAIEKEQINESEEEQEQEETKPKKYKQKKHKN